MEQRTHHQVKAKVYLSDEGYGHIVRQRAITDELRRIYPELSLVIQSSGHIDFASKQIEAQESIKRFNNIVWHKHENGTPDVERIAEFMVDYEERSQAFLEEESTTDLDFILSDFVYEGFLHGVKTNTPAFGVCHFPWDWFFSKLYPRALSDQVFRYMTEAAHGAKRLFFPPFTPSDVLKYYGNNAVEVPFIVQKRMQHRSWPDQGKFKILLMDSGAGLMKSSIQKALNSEIPEDWQIGVSTNIESNRNDIFSIPANELLVDYVKDADLIIGRPGFNTLSECIAFRVPMLLFSETMNPEMEHNIMELKKRRLGAFVPREEFESNFVSFISRFIEREYKHLKESMLEHEMAMNGAEVVAKTIANDLG